ncbi:thioredoxin [Sediminitomix flava]|uniref:Thioredoxin n=2 Tax=Sediminitomix flava TaxID=379075 RepID=A0A315Z070_SEDFL|nr:thioredoxin [Sediminitomix flava]
METIDLRWVKVNVDMHKQAALQCQIKSIPTLILFQKGQELWRHQGEITSEELKDILVATI